MAKLTVNFVNSDNANIVCNLNDVDYGTLRPIDVIQIIYNKGYKPKPSGGGIGTTIWKMGKPFGGGTFDDTASLTANGAGSVVELTTVNVAAVIV